MYWTYNDVCFFFVSVSKILDSMNASILEIGIFSDRKVNQVGVFRWSKFKIPSSFRRRRAKLPTNDEKPLKMGF